MFCHSTNTASFFSNLMAALIFSLSLAGIAAAPGAAPVWGQARFSITPRASTIPPAESMPSAGSTHGRAPTPPAASMPLMVNDHGRARNTASGVRHSLAAHHGRYQHRQRKRCAHNNAAGDFGAAIGFGADVSAGNLTNATASIGSCSHRQCQQ